MKKMNQDSRILFLLVASVGIVCCVAVAVYMYFKLWKPFWDPVAATTDLYTACQQSPSAHGCSPRALYTELCGVTPPDSRCEEFCQGLKTTNPKFCEYMDSCAAYRDDFVQRCSTQLCTPTDLVNCSPDQLRQFCVSGLASPSDCASYCSTYVHCDWVDSVYSDVCDSENCVPTN